MSIAAAIEEMIAEGFTLEQAIRAAKIVEAHLFAPIDNRTAHAKRQERYRERKRDGKASQSVTNVTPGKASQRDAKASQSVTFVTPLARVEDNLLPLETAGGFQEEGVSQGSNEPFETLVPGGQKAVTRKDRVELCQTVVGMWNQTAAGAGLIAVRDITATRQAAIVARSEDFTKTYDFPDALAGWRKLMGLVRGSPFLRGELNGFRCDFDFVTRASSFTKIMEGKYEARQTSGRRR
jgi:hypothetical protein